MSNPHMNEPDDQAAPNGELSDLQQRVINKIEAYFDTGNQTYYLSRLGGDLGEILNEVKSQSDGLEEFIHGLNQYYVGTTGEKNNIKFVAKSPDATPSQSPTKPMRFLPALWKAFHAPLEDEKTRYYDRKTNRYLDVSDDIIEPDTGQIRIDNEILEKAKDANDDDAGANIIKGWLIENNLDPADFRYIMDYHGAISGKSVLHSFVGALSQEQLRRINLPGDVIEKLLRS
jgi:hypothetical protein